MSETRRGFTVLEVLIGVILLVLGAIPVLALFSSQEQEAGIISERLLVTNHLRRQLDRIESRCVVTRFAMPEWDSGPTKAAVGGKNGGLAIEERLTLEPSPDVPGLFEARVEVHWQDPTGKTPGSRELSLSRLLADPERGAQHREWPPRPALATEVGP